MSLLDSASLVVTPNGYKASKLYSIVPSDGTGDMTFARTGDTATRVNSSGLIETVLANKPRLDYTGGGCPKLLLEPQRTNILKYSDDFSNGVWIKSNATISTNATISPDGTSNADKIIENTANDSHATYYASYVSSKTFSFFAKAAERSWVYVISANNNTYFDLSTGTIGNIASGSTAKMEYYGNGWYRCTVYNTHPTYGASIFITTGNGTNSYTGNGTSGVYIWGAQLEDGSYATSYIPTTSASVTRNADNCYKSTASALIGQTEGTIFLDCILESANGGSIYFGITSGTFANFILLGKEAGVTPNKILFGLQANSSLIFFNTSNSLTSNRIKLAIGYKNNDWAAYLNGTLVQSGTSSITFSSSLNTIGFGSNGSFTTTLDKMNVYSAALWKTRLQNADLAALTTI